MVDTITDRLPSQVKALINGASSDRLKRFELSSFMVGSPLADVFEIIDKSMVFFSIYIAKEHLDSDLWEDSRHVDKEKVQLCSRVEEETRKYWWNRNREHLERIDDLMDSYKSDPGYNNMSESELRDKAIEELNREVYPLAIEIVKAEYQELYANEWEIYWKKEDPFKDRTEYRYHRRYDMPSPFDYWDDRNPWQQYYCATDCNDIYFYAQGGSGSSNQRYTHGFYGHLFALLNRQKPVSTYFFSYNSKNQFIFHQEEKGLWLNFSHLIGNFRINREESKSILDGVNKI